MAMLFWIVFGALGFGPLIALALSPTIMRISPLKWFGERSY